MAGDKTTPVASSGAPRPVLKGLHHATIKQNLTVAIGLSIVSVIAWKFLVNEPRKARYAEFYKNYDAQAAFERMRKAGIFNSVK